MTHWLWGWGAKPVKTYDVYYCLACDRATRVSLSWGTRTLPSRPALWLRGWTAIRKPMAWLCPECGRTPGRSAALALLRGAPPAYKVEDPVYLDTRRWDYTVWHALARIGQFVARLRGAPWTKR